MKKRRGQTTSSSSFRLLQSLREVLLSGRARHASPPLPAATRLTLYRATAAGEEVLSPGGGVARAKSTDNVSVTTDLTTGSAAAAAAAGHIGAAAAVTDIAWVRTRT